VASAGYVVFESPRGATVKLKYAAHSRQSAFPLGRARVSVRLRIKCSGGADSEERSEHHRFHAVPGAPRSVAAALIECAAEEGHLKGAESVADYVRETRRLEGGGRISGELSTPHHC
jgi:hypothetical protein